MIEEEYITSTKIAGIFKYPDAKPLMKTMLKGDAFSWKREPENPYDQNAVAVLIGDVKAGYVPRAVAFHIKDATILSITKGIAFDEIIITHKGGKNE